MRSAGLTGQETTIGEDRILKESGTLNIESSASIEGCFFLHTASQMNMAMQEFPPEI